MTSTHHSDGDNELLTAATPADTSATNNDTGTSLAGAAVLAGVAAMAMANQAQAVTITSTSKPTEYDAWRFLTQATFGPRSVDTAETGLLRSKGYVAWLNDQFLKQPKESTFQATINLNGAYQVHVGDDPNTGTMLFGPVNLGRMKDANKDMAMLTSAVWQQFLSGDDQLRQRVAFALSEIFVVSLRGGDLQERVLTVAAYHDLLVRGAFGSLRTLVENIARSPAMGHYLTHMGNQRPSFTQVTNVQAQNSDSQYGSSKVIYRIPDQNFARELLQLFTLGQVKLNMDGTSQLDANGQAIPTYFPTDISVLSYAMTGWGYWSTGPGTTYSYYDPVDGQMKTTADRGFFNGAYIRNTSPESWTKYMTKPMMAYDQTNPYYKQYSANYVDWDFYAQHATLRDFWRAFTTNPAETSPPAGFTVQFLGQTFTPTNTCAGDLKAALDIIFAHQNIAPFIAKQMIQRLVTSNPSRAYVLRVSRQFKASNFSLKTLVTSILLDTEARDVAAIQFSRTFGKLREPVLRMTAALRALQTGFLTHQTNPQRKVSLVGLSYHTAPTIYPGDIAISMGQGPYQAASVFNFFRPGYVEPNSVLQENELVSPEFQGASSAEISAFTSVVMRMLKEGGFGSRLIAPSSHPPGINQGERFGVEIDFNTELTILGSTVEPIPATNVNAYVNSLSKRFFGTEGRMPALLEAKVRSVLNMPTMGYPDTPELRRLRKVKACLLYCLLSAQFAIQK